MKVNLIKYNTFIVCLYLNFFIFSTILVKFDINLQFINMILFPIYFLPLILKLFDKDIGKKKVNKTLIFILLYFIILLLNLLCYIFTDYFSVNFYYIMYSLRVVYLGTLKISLDTLKKYLKYFLIIHLITLIYVTVDKELYEKMRLDYMSFGYDCLFVTMSFAYFHKDTLKIKYLILLILGDMLLFMFGSRFTFLLGGLGTLVFLYNSKKKWIRFLIYVGILILPIVYLNLESILKNFITLLNSYNISIESIERLADSLNTFKSGGGILAERLIWYSETFEIIKENPIFGTGILGYNGQIPIMLYNGDGTFYPHNIFLEILLHFGIVGLLIFLLIVISIIKHIHYNKKNGKKLASIEIVFLIMSLGLLVSGSYIRSAWFYLALLIPFNESYYYINKK